MTDLHTAAKHYEAALKAAFPNGQTGTVVLYHWNEARAALEQPAQQEPVAKYRGSNDFGHDVIELEKALPIGAKLYTSPPQRTWVGLTNEEILHLVDTHVGAPSMAYPLDSSDWINFARAIEAKLKEKNT